MLKKIILFVEVFVIFCFFNVQNSFAKKSKIFIGIDGFNVSTSHRFGSDVDAVNPDNTDLKAFEPNRIDASSSNSGFGFSAGHIAYYRKFFVAPEIFFDYFNSSTPDFFAPEAGRNTGIEGVYAQDELAVNYRYGAKLNIGYNLLIPYFDVFGTVGFGVVDYDMRWKGETAPKFTHGSTSVSPIYGFGMAYEINRNIILRASHDIQKVRTRYVLSGFVNTIDIQVTRIGVMFAF